MEKAHSAMSSELKKELGSRTEGEEENPIRRHTLALNVK